MSMNEMKKKFIIFIAIILVSMDGDINLCVEQFISEIFLISLL